MWGDQCYEQKAAMGNPLSLVIANIFMEHFEEEAIRAAAVKPDTWLCYVDDRKNRGFTGFPKTPKYYEDKYQIHDGNRNRWTITIPGCIGQEKWRKIVHYSVPKKMHTDRYINYGLNHHPIRGNQVP